MEMGLVKIGMYLMNITEIQCLMALFSHPTGRYNVWKSLANNDRNQVEPAIPKTSCGLAHSFVPKWHSEEPFCHASVAELWSCTCMFKVRKGESIQRTKWVFFLIYPWLCCNNNICFKVEIFDKMSEPGSGRCYTINNDLNQVWKTKGYHIKIFEEKSQYVFMNLKPLSQDIDIQLNA